MRAGERVVRDQPLARIDPGALAPRLAALRAEAERALYAGAAAGERGDAVARGVADLERQEALARLSSADRADRRTHLTSPIDGVVLTAGLAELEGTWLEAGDVFCQVSTLDTLRVEVGISEADIGRVQPGQPIRLKVLAFPDRQFRGRVTEVAYQGEETQPGRPTAFKVIGRVANPGAALKSGMTGRARVDVGVETLLSRAGRGLWRWLRLSFYA